MKLYSKKSLLVGLLAPLLISTAVSAEVKVQPGIGGTWYNSSQAGHGFFINIANVKNDTRFVVSWYTFDDGNAIWLSGANTFQPSDTAIEVPVSQFGGADFGMGFNPNDVVQTAWGTLKFTFSSCDKGVVAFNPTRAGFEPGEIEISRLTNTAGVECEDSSAPPDTTGGEVK